MTYEESQIRVIQHIDNDEFVPTLDPAFVVLGMLDEYMGRQAIEGGGTVERFYVDEGPVAGLFARYLRQFATNLGIDSLGILMVRAETGHWYVESTEMNERINALYQFDYPDESTIAMPDGRQLRCAHVALGIDDFPEKRSMRYEPEAMNPRFSYLHGVLLRYGRENGLIRIANASAKVALIKRVLEDLDVLWITHRYSVEGAPCCNEVSFEPRPRLLPLLQRVQAERASAFVAVRDGLSPSGPT